MTQAIPNDNPSPAAAPGHPMLARLLRREPVLSLGIRHARTTDIVRLAKASGHHAIWVDLEHSTIDLDASAALCATAHDLGLLAMVRVPEREYGAIGRLLDTGATGLIFPKVESAAQAADLAGACRFPPQGQRSSISALPQLGYQRLPAAQTYLAANAQVVVNPLIESQAGLDQLEAIARTPGVDLLSIGANDLSAELGVPGDYRHPRMRDALEHALSVCSRVGKPLSIGGIGDAALNADLLRRGAAPLLMTGIDLDILAVALQQRAHGALEACPMPRDREHA